MQGIPLDLLGPPVYGTHNNPASGRTLAAGTGIPRCLPGKQLFRRTNKGLNNNAADSWSETGGSSSSSSDLEKFSARECFGHGLFERKHEALLFSVPSSRFIYGISGSPPGGQPYFRAA